MKPLPVKWSTADRHTILRILRNPVYAGVYVYGITAVDHEASPRPKGAPRRVRRPIAGRVWKENHHEAYTSLETYHENQQRLNDNRNVDKPFAGRGNALCQGLVRCTPHGRPFRTIYPVRRAPSLEEGAQRIGSYRCEPKEEHPDAENCHTISSQLVDPFVEAEVLKVLRPPSIDDVRAATDSEYREYEARLGARKEELRRADRSVTDLEREIQQIADDQPLYKARVRARIETAIREKMLVEAFHRQNTVSLPVGWADGELDELRAILADLPSLWHHPSVMPQQRKVVIRTVIRGLHVTPHPDAWSVDVEWVGGHRTRLDLPTRQGIYALIESEYRAGRTIEEICNFLNERGIVYPGGRGVGRPFTPAAVRRWIMKAGFLPELNVAAHRLIYARYSDGASAHVIAEELHAAGLRHLLGRWTTELVRRVIRQFRRGKITGFSPLPTRQPLKEHVLPLHDSRLFPREIAARLSERDGRPQTQRVVTRDAVWRVLKSADREPHSTANQRQTRELLTGSAETLSVREMTHCLTAGGLRTLRGDAWTMASVRRKRATLHLNTLHRDRLRGQLEGWSHLTLPEMVHALQQAGSKTPRGAEWNGETVRRWLVTFGLAFKRLRRPPHAPSDR